MHELLDRRRFVGQYDDMRQQIASGVPIAGLPTLRRDYRDKAATTTLALDNYSFETDHPVSTLGFDLGYAHNAGSEPAATRPLAQTIEGLPSGLRFADWGKFSTNLETKGPVIGVSVPQLAHRRGLYPLAHEAGHFLQAGLADSAIAVATGQSVDKETLSTLEPYAPALAALTDYTKNHPKLVEDFAAIQEAWQADPTVYAAWSYYLPGDKIPMLARKHEEADDILNAISEASAWMSAITLAEQGVIHPGLRTKAMHDIARVAVASYDDESDLKLHVPTLEYALAHQDFAAHSNT